jgi:hypothetical protein
MKDNNKNFVANVWKESSRYKKSEHEKWAERCQDRFGKNQSFLLFGLQCDLIAMQM